MENENKWEYDYSSGQKDPDTGYPNVGSSGANTANTAYNYGDDGPAGRHSRTRQRPPQTSSRPAKSAAETLPAALCRCCWRQR